MICYKCGQEVGNAKRCPNCGADLSVFLKVRHISNAYYNLGLEQAGREKSFRSDCQPEKQSEV